jgi:nucleoside-diphosphate-sugar epimerase
VYLITGCNGLIGSYIARELLAQGQQIRAIKRPKSDLSFVKDIEEQIEWVEADILNVFSLNDAMRDIECVIHAAAMVSLTSRQHEKMFHTNVTGTENVVNAALKTGVKKLCYISSIAALGTPEAETNTLSENTKWKDHQTTEYAITKERAEREVWRGEAEGLKVLVLNPSTVLAYGDWNKSSSALFKYVWEEGKYYPSGLLNYIDIRDLVQITCQLLKMDVNSERFILNAGAVSFQDFFTKIAQNFDKKKPTLPLTTWKANLAWRLEALFSFIQGREPKITKHSIKASNSTHLYLNTKILTLLEGFEFKSLNDTLSWVCQKYSTENKKILIH